ncbi:MAG: hypothetical protein ACSLEZ_02705 [Thiobacillus sp.]
MPNKALPPTCLPSLRYGSQAGELVRCRHEPRPPKGLDNKCDLRRYGILALDAPNALRAGDALHRACAEQAGARRIATLDAVLGRHAQRMKIKPVAFS